MAQAYNISDAMISYSRRDKAFAERLDKSLREGGREIWVDWEDIAPTVDWWAEIQAGIEAAHTFVFVMSPNSVRSELCRKEIDHAVTNGKWVIPVLYQDIVEDADKSLIHPVLNQHNWIYMRDTDDYQEGFKRLASALETDVVHAQAHTRLLVRRGSGKKMAAGQAVCCDLVGRPAYV